MQFYYSNCEQNAPNLLVLNVQPNEGFSLCVNGKKSNQNNEMQKVKLPYIMPLEAMDLKKVKNYLVKTD